MGEDKSDSKQIIHGLQSDLRSVKLAGFVSRAIQTLEQPRTSIASNNDIGPIAYGTQRSGRFTHFGEVLTEEPSHRCVALAYEQGLRIFITADVYASSKADARISDAAFIVEFQSLS